MAYSPLSKNLEKPCSRCGVRIKQGDPNIHIDSYSQKETDAKVWHKACYEQDLDDGESSD